MNARKLIAFPLAVSFALVPSIDSASAQDAPEKIVPQRLVDVMGAEEAGEPVAISLAVALEGSQASIAPRWTVFRRRHDDVGRVVATGMGATFEAALPPGEYVAHIEVAGTSSVRPFAVTVAGGPEPFALELGGISMTASSNGSPLVAPGAIDFSLYDTAGERTAIRRDIEPRETVVLPAGVYRAVVRYGEHNALTGADIRVRPGEVTHATLGVGGAPVRLSLVREPGATAALAAVSWRVFDDGGKPIMDSDEPSPTLVLAPGAYTAEALHDGWTGVHRFEVVSGEPLDLKLPVGG